MTLMEDMPFKDPFFIIINLAMGGTLGGDIDDGFYTDSLIVDYVRVYEL
jgi:beta-glucanase (GH16 family)